MRSLKYSISKENIFIYLVLFFCFEPKLFVKYDVLNYIFVFGALFSFLIICSKFVNKQKYSTTFVLLILYRLSFALQTFLNMGDVMMWGYMSIVLMTLCLLFDYYIKKKSVILINIIVNILLYLLTTNFIISLLFPNGIIDGIFYVGIRTRISDVIFPLLTFTMINDYLNNKRISVKTTLCIILSILSIIKLSVTTALIGLILYFLGYYLIVSSSRTRKVLNLRLIVYIGLFINMLFIFFDMASFFSNFVVNILHKEANLSSRTLIWSEAIKYIANSPIFGHGLAKDGNFVYWGYIGGIKSLWQAHNNWLQLLYDGGIVTTLFFLRFINYNNKIIKKAINNKITALLLMTVAIFMVMMISEIYVYTPYFYLIIFAISKIEILTNYKGEEYELQN